MERSDEKRNVSKFDDGKGEDDLRSSDKADWEKKD